MKDNGLLEYYKYRAYREGFLDVKSLRFVEEQAPKKDFENVVRCSSPLGRFYKKFRSYFSKESADAEILLSQVYSQAGLTSTIYIPATQDDKPFLLCDDISSASIVQAEQFHREVASKVGCDELTASKPFTSAQSKEVLNYFTQRSLYQKTKMRSLDCATYNADRKDSNYFYGVNELGQAQDVYTIDYERSGIEARNIISFGSRCQSGFKYPNDFGLDMSRIDVLDQIKHNEMVASVVSLPQIAEEIGSVNVKETALDIARTTGYVVEPKYVDLIAKSLNQTAEMLVK